MLRKVLFVDDEPKVLEGLRRMLRPLRGEWELAFAGGGAQALELLDRALFDVVVTDLRMPGMDGAQLLAQVRGRHPRVVRIVLTGQSSREAVLRAGNVAHRQLSKPCDPELLKEVVRRSCALRDLLGSGPLLTLLSRLESVPSMPAMYAEVVKELESAEPSMQRVGEVIARDVGISARILQMVHSAFLGMHFHVGSPAQAATYLGAETTKLLVLAANIFSLFDPEQLRPFLIEGVWAHSQAVGRLAGAVARAEGCSPREVEYAAVAGLLHDTGQVVLAGYLPEEYRRMLTLADERGVPASVAEREVFGTTHAEVGAYLFGLWGLPDPIVEAVAWHHRPGDCPAGGFGALGAVHAADALADDKEGRPLDHDYLGRLGVTERVAAWQGLLDPGAGE
ncbi:MAG TPA: response regulator [Gemmataceae bacterium]|nr:response regulator [Gemmataceae bacterium]